jgi:uncharacterized membrane protein
VQPQKKAGAVSTLSARGTIDSMKASIALRALGSGAATGLRTMAGPTTAARGSTNGWTRLLPLLAIGELIVDKLPTTPSRTLPPALAARAVAGAVAGAAVAELYDSNPWLGGGLGIVGAVGTAYIGRAYRELCHKRHIPDFVAAILEDAAAVGIGLAARGSIAHSPQEGG